MGKKYLIDTNSAIDYLAYKLPAAASKIIDKEIVQMSVITRIELLAWPNISKQQVQF